MSCYFQYDARLGIETPALEQDWDSYPSDVRVEILFQWEQIRGVIPDRIMKLESVIIRKQNQLDQEDDFITSCRLNSEIADLASIINDLHLWFRINQDLEAKTHH
ncbi:hypothetical protein P5G65_05505 [Paenibacillus chondroitinus]|uniref:Radical SAM protein n=1 Tax=Paenibacillus chondroitinus TaxID=59842 RepID=A0ABU6D6J6_9BACL|nr:MULTISPECIES: hypothetical protein [Paenibacillus]MCY9662541.1 hypothetical protein [Paenibacillus anseongense]MEB4793344.1 hypothetical protein [Paenibacillus chondroitinus]